MAITLGDSHDDPRDLEEQSVYKGKSLFTKVINCIRIYNIPIVNFVIIGILGFFLFRLTTKYTGLYMKSSLITIIVTNLVLFGISETLAQTMLCYKPTQPLISFRIDHNRQMDPLSFNSNDIRMASDNDNSAFESHNFPLIENEDMERFMDYIEDDNDSITSNDNMISVRPYNPGDDPQPPILECSYFQFNRLAGFMVWGCVMAFAQCWWYKFLQIYAKDPKVIEVIRKVLTDQLCYSPVSLFCFFTYGTMVLESGSWQDAKDKLNHIYLKTLMINYSVWFPVQFFNFLIVPRSFQVPFSSSISVLWNCYLSMKNSSG